MDDLYSSHIKEKSKTKYGNRIYRTYKSYVGAFVSVVVFGIILAYLINRLNVLITKKENSIAKKSFMKNLDNNSDKVDVGRMGFDFAF